MSHQAIKNAPIDEIKSWRARWDLNPWHTDQESVVYITIKATE